MPINTALTVCRARRSAAADDPAACARGLAQADLPVGLFCDTPVQSCREKYFAGPVGQIRGTESPVSSHRGALANVINAARDAVDAEAHETKRADADGEVVWS
jgi:hypothetical protein